MRIWLTRHGQTRYNIGHRMQGRTDEPLNATGIMQARMARKKLIETYGNIHFDAVYASPLDRAIMTGSIIGDVSRDEILVDNRLIEVNFGRYELHRYALLGPRMHLYWMAPEIFPAPPSVESTRSMRKRSSAFLKELESMDYQNVLVACHGGILRALSGYMEDRRNGLKWRPRPENCEIRIYDSVDGKHSTVGVLK